MAKTQLNSALNGISGGIDNWVYRSVRGRTVISRRGTNTNPLTEPQLAVRERFRLAADYAKAAAADPVQQAIYAPFAKERGVSLFSAMMTDYLKPPVVNVIDLTGYHGQIGQPIRVRASDDIEVMGVRVTLQAPDLTVLEEGPAVLQFGTWVYAATTVRPAGGVPITITATATDRPGNLGTKSEVVP